MTARNINRMLTLIMALAAPAVLAQTDTEPPTTSPTPSPTPSTMPPSTVPPPPSTMPPAKTQSTTPSTMTPTPAPMHGAQFEAELKGHILPAAAGLRAAQLAAAAMHDLAATDPFQKRDARRAAELAEQSVNIAHDSMDAMGKLKGLSGKDQSEAMRAVNALRDARTRVEAMQRQVGLIEGPFRRHEVERIQTELPKLDRELAAALTSIERIASAHTISIALSTPAATTAPAMGK